MPGQGKIEGVDDWHGRGYMMDVSMECDNLLHFPQFEFPPGYSIRSYLPGDELAWIRLHQIGDALSTCEFNESLFFSEFGRDVDLLQSRIFYVVASTGEIVGSISAWFTDEEPARGRIHWVIVHPRHRQRGLSKAMMSHAMQRLAQSHKSAVLDTSLARPWAIKLYLDFGFLPAPSELRDAAHVQGWSELQNMLQHPQLAHWLEEWLEQRLELQ